MMAASIIAAIAVVCAGLGYLLGNRRAPGRPSGADGTDETMLVASTTSEHERVSIGTLRDAIDRLDVGVLICSSRGDVMFRNRRVDELAGTHVGLLVDDHITKIVAATLSAEPTERVIELHGPPKHTLSIMARPTPDGGVVATVRDVSERVLVDTMRTDFVANISHELRTPVGAIAVLAETLAGVDDLETVGRLSLRLVAEAHRAVDTIDDLMELSLIESHAADLDDVDVRSLVEEALGRGRSAGAGRGLRIAAIGIEESLFVRADRTQLLSALGNLVENAVKYSHDGGLVQLRVRRDDRWLEIMVADQGVGIPARDLDRVFERFYRVDKARGRTTGGSGLGLSIVRHVAHNHGGDISVSSREGEGATFVLRLPARLIVDERAVDDSDTPAADRLIGQEQT